MSVAEERIAKLRTVIEEHLAPATVEIEDDSAAHIGHPGAREGGHFRVRIVSERFRGRSTLERHRLVYEAVGPVMKGNIHALGIIARTPEEIAS